MKYLKKCLIIHIVDQCHLFGATFKNDILLTLLQTALLHGPEMKNPVLPLQQFVQDGCTTVRHDLTDSNDCTNEHLKDV